MARETRPELIPFIKMNEIEKSSGSKVPWKERYVLIQEIFPSSIRMDWHAAFKDIELWGRLLEDIFERDQRENGTNLGPIESRERLRQLAGDDFTYVPFTEAFNILAGNRSLSHLASKLGLGRNIVYRLKSGDRELDIETIAIVARAFGKEPSYFVEYRIAYILGAIGDQMAAAPEMSIDMFRKIKKRNRS
jgi:hypothetical protein